MLLEVRRELVPLDIMSGQWALRPYSQVVWKHDGAARTFPAKVPRDYVLGLLVPSTDGTKVAIPIFDAALEIVRCSRRNERRTR